LNTTYADLGREWADIAAAAGDYADDYCWPEITEDIMDTVNAALPDHVTLLGNGELIGPYPAESPAEAYADETLEGVTWGQVVKDVMDGMDVSTLLAAHEKHLVVADLDAVARYHLDSTDGNGGPLLQWADETPHEWQRLQVQEWMRRIKSAFVIYWASQEKVVHDCPDEEVDSRIAAGRIERDQMFTNRAALETAIYQAWEGADIPQHRLEQFQREAQVWEQAEKAAWEAAWESTE